MAKSPVGGSRAYITGRIGSDVYSLGKDGKGKRQQVVRALAEEVANPRSQSQMVNRMIMSTVMQAVKVFSPIIDHSFDGVAKGQPSVSEFIRRNYNMLKSGDKVYNLYQEKGIVKNPWIISVGKVAWPAECVIGQSQNDEGTGYGRYGLIIKFAGEHPTVGDLRSILQRGGVDDYVTVFGGNDRVPGLFCRYKLKDSVSDETLIEEVDSELSLFETESNTSSFRAEYASKDDTEPACLVLSVGFAALVGGQGAILSTKVNGKWLHTSCTLLTETPLTSNFDTALATYPVGVEQFLNGGDI